MVFKWGLYLKGGKKNFNEKKNLFVAKKVNNFLSLLYPSQQDVFYWNVPFHFKQHFAAPILISTINKQSALLFAYIGLNKYHIFKNNSNFLLKY